MTEAASDFCTAYGCPLFGSYGAGGRWYCCCHRNGDASRNDAITAILDRYPELVREALTLRRMSGDFASIENQLVEFTRGAGERRSTATAGVIGPTHARPHYSESEK